MVCPTEAFVGSLMVYFSSCWILGSNYNPFNSQLKSGRSRTLQFICDAPKGAMYKLVRKHQSIFWNKIHIESRCCHIMGNISHLEKEMAKVIVVKTARPRVYSVSAGWWGDRRKQICHRILKFAFYKCIQKVAVLLLCSSLPHLNLIITALCKIWDSQRLIGWMTEVASCSCSWLNSAFYNNIHENWSQWESCKDSLLYLFLLIFLSSLFNPLVWLVFIIYSAWHTVVWFLSLWKKGHDELLLCISVFSQLWGALSNYSPCHFLY